MAETDDFSGITEDMSKLLEKRPVKSKHLKIIDHLGTYYATFDGSVNWKVEKWLFNLLKMCDGKRTFDQISRHISKIAEVSVESARENLKEILEELEREKFVSYV
jgi:hypothetical protein